MCQKTTRLSDLLVVNLEKKSAVDTKKENENVAKVLQNNPYPREYL